MKDRNVYSSLFCFQTKEGQNELSKSFESRYLSQATASEINYNLFILKSYCNVKEKNLTLIKIAGAA